MILLIVNPIFMLGLQWHGQLYTVCQNTCVVLHQSIEKQLPYIFIVFSYTFIQAAMVYLYLNPLYKNRFQKQPSYPRRTISHDAESNSVKKQLVAKLSSYSSGSPRMGQRSTGSSSSEPTNSTPPGYSSITLEDRIQRWLLLGLICIISDIICATIIAVFLLQYTPASVISYMFLYHDASMFINVVCMIACFSVYKHMFFPFKLICSRE
uniref:Uncharacterized protein n=1 Tax=Ciona savignyi TaxID=51511 RepID=H2Z937_CIOSA